MTRNLLRFIYLNLAFLTFYSCGNDDDITPTFTHTTCTTIDLGDFRLSDDSISSLPYLNKEKIVFVDSVGNNAELSIIGFDVWQGSESRFYRYNIFDEGDTVKY